MAKYYLREEENITYQPDGLAAHPLCGSNAVHFHPFSCVKIFQHSPATLKNFALLKEKTCLLVGK